ncbi:hypothetical protein [Polyangium aurulentum]|uniref:hypothetical protein n=1 Tax=Polyangium aurulentum TaxID=2567896 RepID=UPI00200E8CD5|nr:hypothetical protein [Polyangium aurulentum]UQA63196.1 hypothetical protein E8A73_023120 [Polyangium aurulentum]
MGTARNKTSRAEGSEGASTGGCYTTGRTPGRLPETNGGTGAPRAAPCVEHAPRAAQLPEGCAVEHEPPEGCAVEHEPPEGCAVEHEPPEGCAVEHEPPEGCAVEHEPPERPRRLLSACPNAWRFIGGR